MRSLFILRTWRRWTSGWRRLAECRRAGDPGRREAGFSAVELLLLTAPLCLLSLVITSKLAATSTAHLRAGWQASLSAQRDSRAPCGGNRELNGPWNPETDPEVVNRLRNRVVHTALLPVSHKLGEMQALRNRMAQGIGPLTERQARSEATVSRLSHVAAVINLILGMANFVIEKMAAIPEDILTSPELVETNWSTQKAQVAIPPYYFQAYADRLVPGPGAVSASATFVCNEPDGGDQRRDDKRSYLLGFATEEAEGIFF